MNEIDTHNHERTDTTGQNAHEGHSHPVGPDGKPTKARLLALAAGALIFIGLIGFSVWREFATPNTSTKTHTQAASGTSAVQGELDLIIPDGKGGLTEEEMEGT